MPAPLLNPTSDCLFHALSISAGWNKLILARTNVPSGLRQLKACQSLIWLYPAHWFEKPIVHDHADCGQATLAFLGSIGLPTTADEL